MNFFEVPMPFNKKRINSLLAINKELTKSQIGAMYNGTSTQSNILGSFQQERTWDESSYSLETLFPYIEQVFKNDVQYIFLLNGTKIPTDKEFEIMQEELYNEVKKLLDFGVRSFRIGNTLIAEFLSQNFNNIELRASTSFEFQTIKQYQHLITTYPQFTDIVPSYEHNHNFRLLESLRKLLPQIGIELMVNEGCISGCPFRNSHNMMSITSTKSSGIYYHYCKDRCFSLFSKAIVEEIFKSNIIYPWQISEYNAIDINHFKLVGRNSTEFFTGEYDDYYKAYLYGIEDIHYIDDMPILAFSNYFIGAKKFHNVKVKDVIRYLPDIRYFRENGHLCHFACMTQCDYCSRKAEQFLNDYKIINMNIN